jgi:hypothetical protein
MQHSEATGKSVSQNVTYMNISLTHESVLGIYHYEGDLPILDEWAATWKPSANCASEVLPETAHPARSSAPAIRPVV